MALSIGAPGRSPEAHPGEVRYRSLRRVPRHHRADRRAGARGHHAHVRQHQRSADHPQAHLRQQPRHAGRPRQRHHRHPHHPRQPDIRRSRRCRSAPPRSITSSAAISTARRRNASSGVNLGLYSITFNNDTVLDREALEEYKQFRLEAERKGFRHFLEVFDPNRPEAVERRARCPEFINDAIVRTLGGVTVGGPAAVPQDGLSRPQGDGGAGPLRSAPGRRHPRRLGRHHLRRLQAAERGEEVRRPRRPVRPQDQQCREPAGVHPASCG